MCILKLISEKDYYGYDIMKEIHNYFPEVNESTFYAVLRRLHIDGWHHLKEIVSKFNI